jgi:hypothetical protein
MQQQNGGPASTPARGLFDPANRAMLMGQVIGEPTGIIVEIAGQAIDLVPLSTRDGKKLVEMAEELFATWKGINGGSITDADIFATLGAKLPEVLTMMKRVLQESAGVTPEQQEIFDEWFESTRFVPTFKALVPKVLRANGLGKIADRLERAAANPSTPATEVTTSTPATEMQSD